MLANVLGLAVRLNRLPEEIWDMPAGDFDLLVTYLTKHHADT